MFKLVPLSFIVLNGILAISALIAAHLSWTLAVIISIMLGLVAITISFFYREASVSWTALMAVVAGLICGMYISSYYDVKDRAIVTGISLAEAVNHREAGGYTFNEGKVRTDLMGTHVRRRSSGGRGSSSTSTSYYYAAPVVNETWNPRQPVTVWAVQISYNKKELWEQPFRAGIRAEAIFAEELGAAVQDAIDSHGLNSHPGAVLIQWVRSPQKAVDAYLDDFKETAVIFNIIWLAGLLAGRVYIYLRRRKTKEHQPPKEVKSPKEHRPITTPDLLRFLFAAYCFFALVFALYFSGMDFFTFIPIMLLVIGIVFFIIAVGALSVAHKKEGRHWSDLLMVMAYPYLVYLLVFLTFDIKSKLFWMFPGYFYFLVITGGFILGILFSPIIARGIRDGFQIIGKMGVMKYVGLILAGVFAVLVWFFTRFLAGFTPLSPVQTAVFWFFLLLGIFAVIKFSYRHSAFGTSN